MRSGFATLAGRPNVGKSTLLNQILGKKVSITSPVVQTTRTAVRGILNQPDAQVVFVDTPGIHTPKGKLGRRLNETASSSIAGVDVPILVLDAKGGIGKGDHFVANLMPTSALCVLNKVDLASPAETLRGLSVAGELGFDEYFPVSAKTGQGVEALVDAVVGRLPIGERLYPVDVVSEAPEAFWVAELVREQLFRIAREEVPHSIACRVTEWEWPRIRCEILVERDSQKGIVIGHRGEVLKRVGIAVRRQMPEGAYLDLVVKVDPDWQRRPESVGL